MQSVKLIQVVPIDRPETRTLLRGHAFCRCLSSQGDFSRYSHGETRIMRRNGHR